MLFKDLNLPLSVTTASGNPINDFFVPVLSRAVSYDIAVGFFTSNWISDAAEGIAQFACNGGISRWVISPKLNEEDYHALKKESGELDPEKVELLIEKSFDVLFNELQNNTRTMISWLIAEGVLQFKIGIPKGDLKGGDLHAKMGFFRDNVGSEIGFSGSYNLTGRASTNWERIDLFCSWELERERERIEGIKADFESMWLGKDKNLEVFTPSERAFEKYIEESNRTKKPYGEKETPDIRIPESYVLRPYQQEAINAWFRNNGRGIFNMATGSGKTITALSAAALLCDHVIKDKAKLVLIMTVPYKHLADQWEKEASAFGFKVIKCYGSANSWKPIAQNALLSLTAGNLDIVCFVTVNVTFSNPPFQSLINGLSCACCLIADEMHNLGASGFLLSLPDKAQFRLGLSATPVRHGDEQGTLGLERYFGKELINFSLKDAIDNQFLCPYYYHPVVVELTDEEMFEYKELSLQIARLFSQGGQDDGPSDRLKFLLLQRARLIGMAENKLIELARILTERKSSSYNIIYCGDASDGDERHVEKTLRIVGKKIGMRAKKFTADESPMERTEILRLFESGDLQALVAIRCLDEGVDIPKTETAFILASSTNPRQFIQRRGRVLRKSKGKLHATIFDFIAVPNLDHMRSFDNQVQNIERNMVKRELVRINEFAEMAINSGAALKALREVKSKLHLLDM